MTTQQYLEEQLQLWKLRFINHEAFDCGNPTLSPNATVHHPRVIEWRKPRTSIDGIRFVLSGSFLCCIGDLGDSVLQWSDVITPQFLATCDFHYWFGKKRAWPGENGWRQWDDRVAAAWAQSELKDFYTEERIVPDCLGRLEGTCGEMDDFIEAADECGSDDWELAAEIRDAGLVPDCQAISQWVGLQMALHKLGIRKEAL